MKSKTLKVQKIKNYMRGRNKENEVIEIQNENLQNIQTIKSQNKISDHFPTQQIIKYLSQKAAKQIIKQRLHLQSKIALQNIKNNSFIDESKIDPNYIQELKEFKNQQEQSFYLMKYNNDIYYGLFKNKQMFGYGELYTQEGFVFKGYFKNNDIFAGLKIDQYGNVYEGFFKDRKASGKGKLAWKNGNIYEGDWHDDTICGYGKVIFNDGNQYEGEFFESKKHGYGCIIWQNKTKYEGELVDDIKEGVGLFSWAFGHFYIGEFSNDIPNGIGSFFINDGRQYKGEFKNSMYDGNGAYEWPDGRKYVGKWRLGLQHGNGQYINNEGLSFEGVWDSGEVIQVNKVKKILNDMEFSDLHEEIQIDQGFQDLNAVYE